MSFLNKKKSKTCRVGQIRGERRAQGDGAPASPRRSLVVVLRAEDDVRQRDAAQAHDDNRHRLHRAEQASGHRDTGGDRAEIQENQPCCPNDGTVHDLAIFGLSVKLASHEKELKSLQSQLNNELQDNCSRRMGVFFLPRRYCTPSASDAVSKYNELRLLILETAKPLYEKNCIHLWKLEMLLEKCEELDPEASALQRLAISLDRYAMRQLLPPRPDA